MKTSCLAVILLSSTAVWAQTSGSSTQVSLPAPTAYSVVQRDGNSRVWERTVYERGPEGTIVPRNHRYTELATGMHYQKNGQWLESKEEIDLLSQGGAAATQGQHQAYFPGDIAQGVIQMVTPDGRQLQSRPVALAYDDGNQTVLIAILTNSVGELVGSNEVIYPNAFEGATASLRYTYTRVGFEQDVIVQGQLPAPDSFGLNGARAKLLVMTEFVDTKNPEEISLPVNPADGLSDRILKFGQMNMVGGRAFSIGTTDQSALPTEGTPTYKRWLHLQGRTFLIEEVPYSQVAPQLEQLPATGRVNVGNTNLIAASSVLNKVSTGTLQLPPRGLKSGVENPEPKLIRQLARTDWDKKPGLVLDYVTLNSSLTNYVFQADTTYYVTGDVYLYDATTIEGGTVVKYDKLNGNSPSVRFYYSTVNCFTTPYHPAVFTAKDDDTVGETISGSTGSPIGQYAYTAVTAYFPPSTVDLHDLRVSYAKRGIYIGSNGLGWHTIRDSQIRQVANALILFSYTNESCVVQNVLISDTTSYAIAAISATCAAAQLTIDQVNSVVLASVGGSLRLTNSLLVQVSNSVSGYTSVNNATNSNSITVFQTVGAGSHYLASNSTYRNAGMTNIDPSLLADLATKTTYPPTLYSNATISVATTYGPQVQRDTDTPDLGYHYDPLDYCFGGVTACSNVTFTAGTAVGWFELPGSSGLGYGISLTNNMFAIFNGTAISPCIFTRYDAVQEGGNGLWKNKGTLGGLENGGSFNQNSPAGITAAFTDFTHLAGDPGHFRDGTNGQPIVIRAKHCEFDGAASGGNMLAGYTNCLFYRAGFGISTASSYPYQYYVNCTFYGGNLTFGHTEGGAPYWYSYIHDCAFDGTTFNIDDPFGTNTTYANYNYNAFNSGAAQPPTEGANTVTVTGGFNWQSSWFGGFYQPTNSPLINAGDRTADQIGLYHFTMQTNQVVDGSSTVDIGYHYVATDAYGYPLDSNGDGIPDYLQDANGNGLYDAGDLGDWVYGLYNGLTTSKGLLVFTPLK
jgi:hypothetical protein